MTDARAKKEQFAATYRELKDRLHQRVVGLDEVIDLLLIGVISGGHCLLVGVPGLAKTLLIRSLADLLDLKFSRIQFTPDLMPSDIVGNEMIADDPLSGERAMRFMPGPVFANLLLADEINRTPPKTQASLMEAMEERQVSVGGRRYPLERPFFVLATQNPIEQEGTYPLPAAQLDRFLFLIQVDYPSLDEEKRILRLTTAPTPPPPSRTYSKAELLELMDLVAAEVAPPAVIARATELARRTRPDDPSASDFVKRFVAFGVGPRGAQSLVLAAKVRALLAGRGAAQVSDVDALVKPTFRHRLVLNFKGAAEGISAERILGDLLGERPEEPKKSRGLRAALGLSRSKA